MEDTSASAEAGVSVGREPGKPPRGNLFRGSRPGFDLRRDGGDDGMPTMFGHFAVFNRWTEIDSWFEGNFLERISPGAFKKTFTENKDRIRALFQHGKDPQIGDKPLGRIQQLREDEEGGYYEVELLDTAYNRELLPGLEAGLYGASFRFEVMREEFDEKPEPSDDNPRGLPERTLKELRLFEFGPVTFPAYQEATAGVRALTDEFLFAEICRNPTRARELLAATPNVLVAEAAPTVQITINDTIDPQATAARVVASVRGSAAASAPSDPTPPDGAPRQPERRATRASTPTREEFLAWASSQS